MIETFETVRDQIAGIGRPLHVGVLTTCTSRKRPHKASAETIYTGEQHMHLLEGISYFRKLRVGTLSLSILSAKYGLIPGDMPIEPYNVTFSGMGKLALRAEADRLGVPDAVQGFLSKSFDLRLLLLGNNYYDAAQINVDIEGSAFRRGGRTVLLCSRAQAAGLKSRIIRPPEGFAVIGLGRRDASRYGCGLIGLKGLLAARLLAEAARQGGIWEGRDERL